MRGTMMDFPLTLRTILERAGKWFPKVEIVSRRPDLSVARSNYRLFSERAQRLASALTRLGRHMRDWSTEAKYKARAKQGWPVPFLELRITRPSEFDSGEMR
jgi:acyl-CoA synthetase (AMP-forming)/AMP-acid ligase II